MVVAMVVEVRQPEPLLRRWLATLLVAIALAAPLAASCEPLCAAEDMDCCSRGPLAAISPPCCASAAVAPRSAVTARTSPELEAPPVAVAMAPVRRSPSQDTTGRYPPDGAVSPRGGAVPLFLLHASFLS